MKNKILVLLFYLNIFIINTATPYYPGGIPGIGPLKGNETFWGADKDGNYFDGVSYGADYIIGILDSNQLRVKFNVNTYSNTKEADKQVRITLKEPIKGFTGEIIIQSVNSNGKIINRNYTGSTLRELEYIYDDVFNFDGVDNNAKVILKLILDNGKSIDIKLQKSVSNDWISISRLYPVRN